MAPYDSCSLNEDEAVTAIASGVSIEPSHTVNVGSKREREELDDGYSTSNKRVRSDQDCNSFTNASQAKVINSQIDIDLDIFRVTSNGHGPNQDERKILREGNYSAPVATEYAMGSPNGAEENSARVRELEAVVKSYQEKVKVKEQESETLRNKLGDTEKVLSSRTEELQHVHRDPSQSNMAYILSQECTVLRNRAAMAEADVRTSEQKRAISDARVAENDWKLQEVNEELRNEHRECTELHQRMRAAEAEVKRLTNQSMIERFFDNVFASMIGVVVLAIIARTEADD